MSDGERAILLSIIVPCCLVEAVLQLSDLGVLGRPNLRILAYDYGAFWPGLLGGWTPNFALQPATMFLSYGFLHGGAVHLALNMVTLWSLARVVIARTGAGGFLWIYVISQIVGGAAFALLSRSGLPMVGASGALFGLAGAIGAWIWLSRPTTAASFRATRRLLAGLVVINVLMYVAFAGRLAWETHLGGFIAGWGVAVGLNRRSAA
ncbi:rhomboid family intramembrane serine protease [Tropicimonas aquimaris]|uniref:Rhomboid family intramembrane serine protease n=1 Tax=Tropicimonas aquimaris TaxID=914152 RepID=A0ABW3IW17_9RHOB